MFCIVQKMAVYTIHYDLQIEHVSRYDQIDTSQLLLLSSIMAAMPQRPSLHCASRIEIRFQLRTNVSISGVVQNSVIMNKQG
jgi:hypothetical protein